MGLIDAQPSMISGAPSEIIEKRSEPDGVDPSVVEQTTEETHPTLGAKTSPSSSRHSSPESANEKQQLGG